MSKIIHNHEPKQYTRLQIQSKPVVFTDNFTLYPGSIYGRYSENGTDVFFVCDNYALIRGCLPVHVYRRNLWRLEMLPQSHYVYREVKNTVLKLGYVPKVTTEFLTETELKNMMSHDRRHKGGSGASRINNNQINNPLQWNEVTELAHWYGKGNASVVACNIR